jgi:hypothetical protein
MIFLMRARGRSACALRSFFQNEKKKGRPTMNKMQTFALSWTRGANKVIKHSCMVGGIACLVTKDYLSGSLSALRAHTEPMHREAEVKK